MNQTALSPKGFDDIQYEQEYLKSYEKTGCFDVLFSNQKGEITEGSRTNLFIKKGDTFYTPPIECGLLDGIYRRQILDDENIKSVEKILFFEDLRSAEQLYLCNSVRGLIPVSLIGH
ncbi:MAG: aminotransferase class IV [Gammaproteobacteria bacterium]|nr:aminotransferase class IV [Gammaproteobacteria bacterium]